MTKEQAEFIAHLRIGPVIHSWRRISELYCEKYGGHEELKGNQLHGMDLCRSAMVTIHNTPLKLIPNEIRDIWDT